jgi:hypothetical protein
MPSLNEFKASFKTDLARPARFDVEIPVPLKLVAYLNTGRQIKLRCENAELPSKTLATAERKIYGPTEKLPYLTTFNDTTMTFMVSDDMAEKKLFDAWMNLINPKTTYDFNYRQDYVTPITVNQYNVRNELSYSLTLIDAFPVSVNQLDLDWSNENTHHKLSVTFAYYTWENNSLAAFAENLINAGVGTAVDAATSALNKYAGGTSYNPTKGSTSGKIYDMTSIAQGFVSKE